MKFLEELETDRGFWDLYRRELMGAVEEIWRKAFVAGAAIAEAATPPEDLGLGFKAVDVDAINKAAEEWIKHYSPVWWSRMQAGAQVALRDAIQRARAEGLTPKEVASQLSGWTTPASVGYKPGGPAPFPGADVTAHFSKPASLDPQKLKALPSWYSGATVEQSTVDKAAANMAKNGWQGKAIKVIVRADGEVVLGPGSLHPALAAAKAGLASIPVDVSWVDGAEKTLGASAFLRDFGIPPWFDAKRALTIATTEITNALGGGAHAQYKLEGYETWVWRTTEDKRVCPICAARDGQEFPIATLFEAAHPNCRCWPVPGKLAPFKEPPKPKVGTGHAAPTKARMVKGEPATIARTKQHRDAGKVIDDVNATVGNSASAAKDLVARKLRDRLESNGDWQGFVAREADQFERRGNDASYNASSGLVQIWAGTSGDENRTALAMQLAAADEFGLGQSVRNTLSGLAQIGEAQMWYEKNAPALRAFLRAQYDITQENLALHGIREVALYRGQGGTVSERNPDVASWLKDGIPTMSKGTSGVVSPELRPLSSFSSSISTSKAFLGSRTPVMLEGFIPASRIISTPGTGYGCLNESEFVVIAGPGTLMGTLQ